MQLLKCIAVYVVITTTGMSEASPYYISTPETVKEKKDCGKVKAAIKAKSADQTNYTQTVLIAARLPVAMPPNREEMELSFRPARML